MKELLKSYGVFVSGKMHLLIMGITCAISALGIFVMTLTEIKTIGLLVAMCANAFIMSLVDFTCFGGIGLRNQKTMEIMKTSLEGGKVIKNAIIGDGLLTILRCLVIGMGGYTVYMVWGGTFAPAGLLKGMAYSLDGVLVLMVMESVARRFCKTLTSHMMFSYLGAIAVALFFIPLILVDMNFFEGLSKLIPLLTGGMCLIAAALIVLFMFILVKEAGTAHKSGFMDCK